MAIFQHLFGMGQDFAVWAPVGIPVFLVYVTLVVFVHEMGHFLMARAFGAKVVAFSIGFGPEIFGFNDKHGTRWKLSWIPVGGYVQFAGDANAASAPDRDADQASEIEKADMMVFRPVHQRALVAVAGPLANFVLAILMFWGLFLYAGHSEVAAMVGPVDKGGPAATAGILPGDLVTSIDGTAVTNFEQLPEMIRASDGQALTIGLKRGAQGLTVQVTPRQEAVKDAVGETAKVFVIGVHPSPNAPIITTRYNVFQAFGAACGRTWDIVHMSLSGIGQIISGRASLDQLHGPVGIAQITRKVALWGILPFISLIAILSVSIGLINLFPIPMLDGGHLLYYACEAVLGRPLGERVQDVGFRLGLVLVLGLMLLATWNDIARLNLF
jgi:regulator of sigma E protease